MGSSGINYITSNCFENFPFPSPNEIIDKGLHEIGNRYYKSRTDLMLYIHLGITKTLNLFHCRGIFYDSVDNNDKQLLALGKHLNKIPNTISFDEAIKRVVVLRTLHQKMDEAVLEAYGWSDIDLRHDFYEVDYLPENDRVRYTIHPEARKEILKRLLELNHKIHAEEVAEDLWDKKKTTKKTATPKSPKTVTGKTGVDKSTYESPELFEVPNLFNQETSVSSECKVILKNTAGKIFKYHITPKAVKDHFTGEYKQIKPDSPFAKELQGKPAGSTIEFSAVLYKIEEVL